MSKESLCVTCRNSKTANGVSPLQEVSRCRIFDKAIPFPVVKCTEYVDRRQPTLGDLYDMAFYIVADKKTGKIGFVNASEYRKEHGPSIMTIGEGW